jgi:zinc transport system substrate-binding protein
VPPLAGFAEHVGGDRVAIQVLVGPGQNPHSFEPTARQVEGLTSAQLFWRVGMPFEAGWLARLQAANPRLAVLDARSALGRPPDDGAAHHHDAGHVHHHDPHVWTSPPAARAMVLQLAEALAGIDPANAAAYRANAAAYAAELDALDAEIRDALADLTQRRFLVYHPAWGEFAATYGLDQVAIDGELDLASRILANQSYTI